MERIANRYRIVTANPALNMVANVHSAATEVKTAVPNGFANPIQISETTEPFKARMLVINRGEDTISNHYKRLLKIVNYDDQEYFSSLPVLASMMNCANTRFYEEYRSILQRCGCILEDVTLQEFVVLKPILEHANIEDISQYDSMEPSHFVFSLALLLNIIGKHLTTANYTAWCTNREKSYAAPLGLQVSDPLFGVLIPSLAFATSMYDETKMFYQIRRYCFMNILAMSNRNDLLGAGMKITVSLLRGAELTNWIFIRYWLIQLNPDILMWNEIAKYLPAICSAYSKYRQLGDLADWCKLILPPTELMEFHYTALDTPFEVAKAISSYYGKTSTQRIETSTRSRSSQDIIDHALHIVKIAGGARTIDVMTLRRWRYDGYNNRYLNEAQDRGASFRSATDPDREEGDRIAEALV